MKEKEVAEMKCRKRRKKEEMVGKEVIEEKQEQNNRVCFIRTLIIKCL